MDSLRILIADDNPLVRCGLRMIIEQHEGWMVCGEAVDGLEAVRKASDLKPNVILLDISMPNLDGLAALPIIRQKAPESEILILTMHQSVDLARIAADRGARAYIIKSLLTTELVPKIEALSAQ